MSNIQVNPEELIYLSHEKISIMTAFKPKMRISTNKGEILFKETLNWGEVLPNHNSTEFFTVLHPSLSDRIMKVKRATTISYPKDIGAIILESNIFCGAKVLEIGTGSAAFTIAVSSIIGPTGKIYSFERREEHLAIAVKNFKKFSLFENAEFILKDDVESTGFGLSEKVNTIYIDVPNPSSLISASRQALTPGGFIIVIVPCLEQVSQAINALNEHYFTRIRIKEIFERNIRPTPGKIRPFDRMIGHTVYLILAQLSCPELS